jgi:uncharacterized membrane protein
MQNRPKIKLTLSKVDQVIETLGWVLLVGLWAIAGLSFSDLPDTIPIHFNIAGEADGFGSKNDIFFLPIIGTLLFLGMTRLNNYPHMFNYPTRITEENAPTQYAIATQMIRVLKLTIILVFGLILLGTLQYAKGNQNGLGEWFVPLTFGLIMIPTFYYLFKTLKNK